MSSGERSKTIQSRAARAIAAGLPGQENAKMKHGDPNYPFSDLLQFEVQHGFPGFKATAKAALTIALAIVVTILVMAL
jgi:hypothetical protein